MNFKEIRVSIDRTELARVLPGPVRVSIETTTEKLVKRAREKALEEVNKVFDQVSYSLYDNLATSSLELVFRIPTEQEPPAQA